MIEVRSIVERILARGQLEEQRIRSFSWERWSDELMANTSLDPTSSIM